MVITSAYVAIFLSCTNPGTATETCTETLVPGFLNRTACEVSVHRIAGLITGSADPALPTKLTVSCASAPLGD